MPLPRKFWGIFRLPLAVQLRALLAPGTRVPVTRFFSSCGWLAKASDPNIGIPLSAFRILGSERLMGKPRLKPRIPNLVYTKSGPGRSRLLVETPPKEVVKSRGV